MERRAACLKLVALASAAALPVRAQTARIARVAWVTVERHNPDSAFFVAFRNGLRSLGWDVGRNLTLDPWGADGSSARLKALIPEIVARRPDVIVTAGGPATRPVVEAGLSIPIVFTFSADPVIGKLVESWGRPGVNRTGISFFSLETVPKRLQIMKEALPGLKRVAIVGWPPHAGELLELEAARTAAGRLGLEHKYYGANNATELEAAFGAIEQSRAHGIFAFAGGITANHPDRFAAFTARSRIPAVSAWADFAEKGNLMTYGPVLEEAYSRLATFVHKVLKGARPAELPVEQPTKIEFVVNLKTAKAIGVQIPQSVLLRADRVIE